MGGFIIHSFKSQTIILAKSFVVVANEKPAACVNSVYDGEFKTRKKENLTEKEKLRRMIFFNISF
jgi:hypothetical protein